MELWLQVLLGVVFGVAIGVGIALIGFILALRRLLNTAEHGLNDILRFVAELRRSLIPAIETWTTAAQQLEKTLRDLEPGLNSFHHVAAVLRTTAERFQSLEERIYRRLAPPLEEITVLVSGILKAVTTFVRFLTNRSRSESP
ncbi:hypothetical protein HRbin21_00206 [bacterium HR21]|jgi:hypothetical protein|nr:hypothetical protein HRbin21_00206 [bacterium HR21]